MPFPPAFDRAWDETFPPDTQQANLLGQDIRNFKTDIRERLALLSGTFVNRPTNMDAVYGGAANGILYFSTDTKKIYQWSGAGWVDVTLSIGAAAALIFGNPVPTAIPTVLSNNSSSVSPPLGSSAQVVGTGVNVAGLYRFSFYAEVTVVGTGGTCAVSFQWHNQVGPQKTITIGTLNLQTLGDNTINRGSGAGAVQSPLVMRFDANIDGFQLSFNSVGVTGTPTITWDWTMEQLK